MSTKFNLNHITEEFKNELLDKCNLCNIANGINYPKSLFNIESKEKKQNDLNHFIQQGGQAIPFNNLLKKMLVLFSLKIKKNNSLSWYS
ncbi:MAG: hypothetical protein KTV77_03165 [Wolbachia endosymbiont of Fragariocoptes setiger]|nr:hypothetical protein [Wolbachia endosymbiont of Fragariocoptes setiger]